MTVRGCAERGSALLEVLVVGVALLVPIGYLGLAVAAVQSASLAATQAVREAARAFVTAPTAAAGADRARAAARLALADHGLQAPGGALRITCTTRPCLAPGSSVVVDLGWELTLPWVPAVASDGGPATVTIAARHRIPVDDFRADAA